MKRKLCLFCAVVLAFGVQSLRATEEQEETFGDKLKKLFVHKTPAPKPHKKKTASSTATHSPTPSASATPSPGETPTGSETASPAENPISFGESGETPIATATPVQHVPTQYFDAVRPITPHPGTHRAAPVRAMPATQSTPPPTMTAVPEIPAETPGSRPMPSLPPVATTAESPMTSATEAAIPSPIVRESISPAIALGQISESAGYSPEVRKIVQTSLELTGRNLSYKYVSADPKNGGMDSSGFIYYVLTQSGIKDAPRDARDQYIWVRKAGNFQAVLAQRDDTFELDSLKPGDLLFWASNYGVSKDPDITQTMIYLGRESGTNQRLMVGASETPSSRGPKRPGVGVFEFKVGAATSKSTEENGPVFVGYGRVPGVNNK